MATVHAAVSAMPSPDLIIIQVAWLHILHQDLVLAELEGGDIRAERKDLGFLFRNQGIDSLDCKVFFCKVDVRLH